MLGSRCGDLRSDAQLHTLGFKQENIKQVEVANPRAVASVRVRAGADRQRGAQQLRYANEIVRRHGQGAAQQGVVGVDIAVVNLWRVVVLKVGSRGQVQRVVALVGSLGVIRQRIRDRVQGKGKQET